MKITLEKYLSEIEDRLKKATPGPWFEVDGERIVVDLSTYPIDADGLVAEIFDPSQPPNTYQTEKTRGNSELIAHAPTDLAKLVKMLSVAHEALSWVQTNSGHKYLCKTSEYTNCEAGCEHVSKIFSARAEIQKILEEEK